MKKIPLFAGALLALAVSTVSWTAKADDQRIHIGVLAPLTGAGGPSGPEEVRAAQKVADYINQAGGVLGKKIQIDVEDDETNPTAGVAGARKLIDVDHAVAITGIWASGVALAVRPIAIERGVAVIANGNADAFTQGDTKGLAWRFMALGTDWGTAFGKVANGYKPKTVAILVMQNPFTLSFVDSFKAEVQKSGAKIVDVVPYNPSQPSYSAEVERVFSKNPDVVFVPGYVTDFSVIARDVYRNGFTSKMITLTHAVDPKGLGKNVSEGIASVLPVPDPKSQTFALYRKLTGVPATSTEIFGPSVFDQVVVTALAIEAAKSTQASDFTKHFPSIVNGPGPDVFDPVEALKLIRAHKPFRYSGAYADFHFRADGDPTHVSYGHFEAHDGENALKEVFQ
ncbi:ABC transporter substrate-binding protein [Robbsia sp. KACC 23696]|uniref:ABC transporter substrate-binding protein n=1 Tax=Robbsia sp. KACC 23696 TaxID=3149231 RepID=UPI00325AE79A